MTEFFKSRLLWIGLAVVVVAATLPLYVSGYILGLLTVAYYFGVFAMAWDLLFGFAGEVNFGPTFLIGVGAYTAGILNNQYGWSVYLCIVLGALATFTGTEDGAAGVLAAARSPPRNICAATIAAMMITASEIKNSRDLKKLPMLSASPAGPAA